MPVPFILSDPSKTPLTPSGPERPTIKVILGTELLPVLRREGGDKAVPLFARAVHHELSKSFPLEVIVVELGKDPKSFIGRDANLTPGETEESSGLVDKAAPVIMRVLSNAARYEWDGKSLATPREAIAYMLDRCQRDPDLGHLVGPGTQAYRLLCEAEACLVHTRLSDVMEARGRTLAKEPRRYLTATEHQRGQDKREQTSHIEDDDRDEDLGGHDMTETA